MALCPHCSAKTLPEQRECRACGAVLDEADDERSSEPPDPLIGQVLDEQYRIDEWIGEGAMGRVYAAHQLALGKDVAIKVLHPHLARDPKVIKRFHREARAASRLSHPNSMQIIDFGADDDGTLYIAMELLDGPDLLEVIEDESPLSPRRIYDMMAQVLDALHAAHEAGIIHRDLKPENVMVVEDHAGRERIKVCDFGIAKIPEAEGGSAITVTGFVCGTPEYMAPEQARGEELDVRADLYAAGAMLYQMLTGRVPFTADSALGIITKHLTEPLVPPRRARPDLNIPAALSHVAEKALRKDRRRRYRDAPEMSEALAAAIEALGEQADSPLGTTRGDPTAGFRTRSCADLPPATGSGPRRWGLALLLVGALALYVALRSGQAGETPNEVAGPDPRPGTRDAAMPQDATVPQEAAMPGDAAAASRAAEQPDASADTSTNTTPRHDDEHDDAGRRGARTPRTTSHPTGRRSRATSGRRDAGRGAADRGSATGDASPPEASSPGERAFAEGRRRFLANDLRGAIEQFEAAARFTPGSARVQKELGRAYMRVGDVTRGVRAYRRYLELSPNAGDRAIVEQIIHQHGG